jgi:hypothetical protein
MFVVRSMVSCSFTRIVAVALAAAALAEFVLTSNPTNTLKYAKKIIPTVFLPYMQEG